MYDAGTTLRLEIDKEKKMSQKFRIAEDGTIFRNELSGEHEDEHATEKKEYAQLEYEIFSHPDRFSKEELDAKKKRYEELKKILGIKDSNAVAFKMAQLKVGLNQNKEKNSMLFAAIKKHRETNKS